MIIKHFKIEELPALFNADYKLTLKMIKDSCVYFKIDTRNSYNMIAFAPGVDAEHALTKIQTNTEKELLAMKSGHNYSVIYEALPKQNNLFYYKLFVIYSSSIDDLKKIVKFNKMKAFS